MVDLFAGVKEWKCQNGHTLGLVKRIKVTSPNGRIGHVSRLMLFRQAVDREDASPQIKEHDLRGEEPK